MDDNRSTFSIRLTFAVRPVDVVTGGTPLAAPLLTLPGVPCRSVRKPDGSFLLLQLPGGRYPLQLQAPHYADAVETVDTEKLDPAEPVVIVPLLPKPSYSFPPGLALLRLRLEAQAGLLTEDLRVRAVITDTSLACGKLADIDPSGRYFTYAPGARLIPGCCYWVGNADAKQREYVRIVQVREGARQAVVAGPLQYAHAKGTPLLEVAEGVTDRNGDCALAFRPQKLKEFPVRVELAGQGVTTSVVLLEEVVAREGQSVHIGKVITP